jgi:hypothetical protein
MHILFYFSALFLIYLNSPSFISVANKQKNNIKKQINLSISNDVLISK